MELLKDNQKNLIFGKYKLTKIIGSGSFGFVYKGINIIDKKGVAVKVEKKDLGLNLLEKESYYLYNLKGIGVPEVVSYGFSGKYNILVQTLLGESLGKIFYKNNYHFPLKDICMFSIQILDRIEYVHSKYIIHRDIKPENFLIGDPDKYMIYIIDFGLSKKYKSSRTNKHVQFRLTKKFTGTARYASLNSIRGSEQSRRDDLEAIGYMLLYFFNGGKLPWQGVSCKQKAEKYVKIYTMKKNLNLDEFCKNMPREIIYFMNYTRGLEFEQKPDYNYLRSLFENVLKENRTTNDLHFSWIQDLSILKNCENSVSKISLMNMGKRKASPQSRIIKQLESSRESNKEKEKENINESKILKMNNSLKNLQNIIILKNPSYNSYNQFIIHKRFNSSGDGKEYRNNKDSENIKSGIAQYNISIDDEQMTDKNSKNKVLNIIGKQNIININPNINKSNNLYYFSNINDTNSNLLNSGKEMTIIEPNNRKNNPSQHNQIKKQNSYSFLIHNKAISNPINNSNSNLNITEVKNLNNNYFSPNIVKSFSYIKKINPKNEVKKDNVKISKDNSPNTNIFKSQNLSFKRSNNIRKIIPNIKKNYKNLKINDIKKQITKVNKNKKVNINTNSNINKINLINIQKNRESNNITDQEKTKKLVTNPVKKNKSRKIIKMKVKNLQNISIQDATNNLNLNYKSAKNILKPNKSQNNIKKNLKSSFIPKNNSNMNNGNVINSQNLANNFSNNFEGKINKLKIMDIHSNMKKIYTNKCQKISIDQLSKENINNNSNDILSQSQNQLRYDNYKNIRHIQQNLPIQKSMTKLNNDLSKKSQMINGTINTTINNSNTINNTINTNNNNNTIISIYNNYNLSKKGNKYGFIHKKIDNNNNIALDTLNNIIKGKNYYSSYNGYNIKLNNFNNYINLHTRKNSTLTNRPTLNNLFNNNYNTLNSKNINDISSNLHNSHNLSNKDFSIQNNNYSKKKMEEYFSIKNLGKESEGNYKNKNAINLSGSRPNLNSFRYQNIVNELNMDMPQNNNKERNTTKNIITNFIVKKNDISKDRPFKYSMNVNRSNSFLYRPNFKYFGLKKDNSMSNLDKFSPIINRKQTEIFYQGLPNFKRNYNIYDSNLINENNEITPKKYRAQSREYAHNNRVKEYDFF